MLAAERTRKHGDLDCPWLIILLGIMMVLLVPMLKILSHLLPGVLEALVSLLRVGHTLLKVIETLISWTHRVLIGLESPIIVSLLLILAIFGLHHIELFQLSFQVLDKEVNLTHYHCSLFQRIDSD